MSNQAKDFTKAYEQISEYMAYCTGVKRLSQYTITQKVFTYHQFVEETQCEDLFKVTNLDVNHWMELQTMRGVSANTLRTRVTSVISMFKYFKDMDYKLKVKIPLIVKPKEEDIERPFYLREEIASVLAHVDDPMDWLIIRLTFDVGLRIAELASLTLDNFNGDHLTYQGKGSRSLDAFLSQETYEKLQDWIEYAGVTDRLWINEYKKPFGVDTLRKRMEKVFRELGYEEMTPHALRHSMCTDVLLHGASEREAQRLMHHKNITTTQRYSHELKDKERELRDKFREFRMAQESQLVY